MCKKHLIWWYINHHFGCKGTTKNAYTQVFEQKKHLFLGKKCTGGGNGGSGGMTEKLPPQAPLPPCCVNKNGALIFREKTIRNEFLRTFEEG